MDTYVTRVVVEQILGPVAVMCVEVDDEHALAAISERGRGDCDVVEQTETHRAPGQGVMSRRSHREECRVGFATIESVDGVEPSSGGEQRGFERRRARSGVGIDATTTTEAELFDVVDVRGVVNQLELGACRGTRCKGNQGLTEIGRLDTRDHRAQPLRPLRMVAAGDVVEVALMCGEQHRHGRRGYPARPESSAQRRGTYARSTCQGDMSEP